MPGLRSRGSIHSRKSGRGVKDKQLELLEGLEAEAWERERTLGKYFPGDSLGSPLLCGIMCAFCRGKDCLDM